MAHAHADTVLYRKLRDARRQQGVTQSQLAQVVGCKQSAISMMERGRPTAIKWESIKRIAEFLDVDLAGHEPPARHVAIVGRETARYCPVYDCPSNLPYCVGDELRFLPVSRDHASNPGSHCRYCGEVLETTCPNADCGAPVVPNAACCPLCGSSYIALDPGEISAPHEWADARLSRINTMRAVLGRRVADARPDMD